MSVRKNYIIIIWIDKINQEKTTNNYTGQQVKSKKGHFSMEVGSTNQE
jgi:hypothetical protein